MQHIRQYEPLFPEREALKYDTMFMERLLENLGNIPTTKQNKVFLQRRAQEYPLSQAGYEQGELVQYLKTADRIVVFTGEDPNRTEIREQRKHLEIDSSIGVAVKDAGEYVVKELMKGINGRDINLEEISIFRRGVEEMAPHYAGDDAAEYIKTTNQLFVSQADQMLTDRVASIKNAAENVASDPYGAPGEAERLKRGLHEYITKCGLDITIMGDDVQRYGRITEQ